MRLPGADTLGSPPFVSFSPTSSSRSTTTILAVGAPRRPVTYLRRRGEECVALLFRTNQTHVRLQRQIGRCREGNREAGGGRARAAARRSFCGIVVPLLTAVCVELALGSHTCATARRHTTALQHSASSRDCERCALLRH